MVLYVYVHIFTQFRIFTKTKRFDVCTRGLKRKQPSRPTNVCNSPIKTYNTLNWKMASLKVSQKV